MLNEQHCYEVDKITIVEPDDTKDLLIEEGKDLLTLVTCTPYGINSHRLLVRGHRISAEEEAREAIIKKWNDMVVADGGSVESVEKIGVKKFAYPINFKNEGYYVLMTFTAPATIVKEMKLCRKTFSIACPAFSGC